MKFILGKKIGMTQVFLKNGDAVPVTRVVAGPCAVVQTKSDKAHAPSAQIGFGIKKEYLLKKPQLGHLAGLPTTSEIRDFVIDSAVPALERGDVITVDTFVSGDRVEVEGVSKGKGFAGVVKRHHFHGGPASHGHKDNLRAPGSIGAGGVQRVFKGMRMAGRMGGDQVTVKNLEVVEVHPETNELYIKGAVPGGRNSLLKITAPGTLKVIKKTVAVEPAPESVAVAPAVLASA